MFGTVVKTIWDKSPREVLNAGLRKGRHLIGKKDQGWNYSLEAVLANRKHMDCKLEIERWERQWRLCRLHGFNLLEPQFDFVGKSVMELGCGPVLGCGPIALFRGAARFWYREPDFVRQALESSQLKAKYFAPLYEELVANYGRKMTFGDWYQRVIDLSAPLPVDADQTVDIAVSNSVLEHIQPNDLSVILTDLNRAARDGSWFSHTVDFGPHGGRLSDIYSRDRHDKPSHLNLLRKSEIERLLTSSGFGISASVIYKADEVNQDGLHETWRTHSLEDLATRVMIFIGNRPVRAQSGN